MDQKKNILRRVYITYFLVCLFGVAILFKIVQIQFIEGDKWREKANSLTTTYMDIEAVRGNIYANDGSLLATSIPFYEVRFDPNTDALKTDTFYKYVDSLSWYLADLFKDQSQLDYKRELVNAREGDERYHLIKRKVKFNQLKKIKEFPIFRRGKYKGGLIVTQQNKRVRPFGLLAARTIGYDRKNVKPGLEGAYSKELSGVSGKRLMQKIAGGVWKPINDENEIEPEDGYDIYSTIDINIQDVAENALLEQLHKHDADHGSVVLMEVHTGEVRAIANLRRDPDGDYYEYYNYAIGESTEPGSTYKLASLMAALEDGYVDLGDTIDCEDGEKKFYGVTMKDSKRGGHGKLSVQQVFEESSNIGVMKIINKHYSGDPKRLNEHYSRMHLDQPIGIEIAGEGMPYIKGPNDSTWSQISPLWMAIGYELTLTPLQVLTFYNAVANDGKMVKPMFVKKISKRSTEEKVFEPVVIKESICSRETIEKAKKMMEGVVQNGTAKNLRHSAYKIAGKTGTAQIANDKTGYGNKSGSGKKRYQASFAGYFPADNPKYSCIVVVSAPNKNEYYASEVAGPIFKEIADKVYSSSIEIHNELEVQKFASNTRIPVSKNGYQADLLKIFSALDVPAEVGDEHNDWVVTQTGTDKVKLDRRKVTPDLVPNVIGMDAQDAVFLLENSGLTVKLKGRGVIKAQSLTPGSRIEQGQEIVLEFTS